MARFMNWAYELNTHDRESENKVLAKAKATERELLHKGYRWFSLKPTYKVLIPCDEEGNPTKEGEEKLQKHKEMLNIV